MKPEDFKKNPLVSVVITTYNQKEFLKQAIDSVNTQDYEHMEIIVADDCSTDGTEQMMACYQDNYKVKYYRNPVNLGPGNNGCYAFYKYVKGEFVLYLNHDDYLTDNTYITTAVEFLLKNPTVSFVYAKCDTLMQHTGEIRELEIQSDEISDGRQYFLNYGYGSYNLIPSVLTSLFRRENAIKMNCFKEDTKSKDLFLYLKLMLTGDVGFINRSVGIYRIHGQSLSYNMPIEYDYSTILELEKLKGIATLCGFSKEAMDIWINQRVYQYFLWRVQTLSYQQKALDVKKILMHVAQEYPYAAKEILNSLK